jgi:hypothetical protein
MINILKRTLVILAAAFVIVGALVGFSKSGLATSMNSRQPPNREVAQAQSTNTNTSAATNATTTEKPPMTEHAGGGPSGVMAIVSVLSNLPIIGILVLLIQLGARVFRSRKPHDALRPS